ncbi:MAG: TfoX/Sxy family protein [Bacteroidetes bacterium]|nr:TfoX/Sxy family protein [Bacteroidota bacterium]
MAYSEKLAEKIRQRLAEVPDIEEKEMFGGIAFMNNGKMCVGIIKEDMMCRIDPDVYDEALEKNGCGEMRFTGKPMRGWVIVEEPGFSREKDFEYWIQLSLDYNHKAKKSVKKSRSKKKK